jgi:hypothetical protein
MILQDISCGALRPSFTRELEYARQAEHRANKTMATMPACRGIMSYAAINFLMKNYAHSSLPCARRALIDDRKSPSESLHQNSFGKQRLKGE